ncbi:MAG: hypothetical protein JWO00_500 [Candidatus Parcubacteria bacterium]|nr:hypothetical protein [Candidatus Parcubacteria bacterium]
MNRDYSVTSPSLGGFLTHDSLIYEGIKRPTEMLQAMDGPAGDSSPPKASEEKILEQYFYDLYGVFMKRLSQFVLASYVSDVETVKLQAMLQEMVKIKKIMGRGK